MRPYPTATCQRHYYYKEGKLFENYEPGSMFLLAPGDVAWKTDLDILRKCDTSGSDEGLNAVVAKYLINRIEQD